MKTQSKPGLYILIIIGTAAVVFAIWFAVTAGTSKSTNSSAKQPKPLAVKVQPVKTDTISQTLDLSGEVVAVKSVVIAATKEGPITFSPWRESDKVKSGEKLVEIDREFYRADVQMAQAALTVAKARFDDLKAGARPEEIEKGEANVRRWTATLEEARTNYEREQQLLQKKFASQQSVDAAYENMMVAESELASAKETLMMLKSGPTSTEIAVQSGLVEEAAAKLEIAKVNLAECTVTAPFDGVIQKVHIQPGDFASPRAPLIEMYDPKSLVLKFDIPEAYFSSVHPGINLNAELDAMPGKKFSAEVVRVYPKIDEMLRTQTVEARLIETDGLVPNMFARITLNLKKTENALVIPAKAVLKTQDGEQIVFVVKDGKAHRRKVELGTSQGQIVQIVKGLENGEQVVVAGQNELRDGQEVKIAGSDKSGDSGSPEKTKTPKSPPDSSTGQVSGK